MRSAWPWLLVALVACNGSSPAEPAPIEPEAVPEDSEKFPPAGMYEVQVKVVSDTCTPAYVAPAPWRGFVHATAKPGGARVNLGLTAVPPSSATLTAARSDFRVEPHEPVKHTFAPPDCAGYTAERTFEITEANRDGFTLAISVTHGDAGTCAPTFPANCTTTVEQVFRVVQRMCRAECYRDAKLEDPSVLDPDQQRWIVDCRCDGAPAGGDQL